MRFAPGVLEQPVGLHVQAVKVLPAPVAIWIERLRVTLRQRSI